MRAGKGRKLLKRQASQAKYDVFCDGQPLVTWLRGRHLLTSTFMEVELFKKVVVGLRLTTLFRSVDLSQMCNMLHQFAGRFYVCTVGKNAKQRVKRITGSVLDVVVEYPYWHRKQPCPFLLRRTNNQGLFLSSDRLAKYGLCVMCRVGIKVGGFNSHSLCGETATFLLALGVPKADVQAHGLLCYVGTLDDFYARLRLMADWVRLLSSGRRGDGTSIGGIVSGSCCCFALACCTECDNGSTKGSRRGKAATAYRAVRPRHCEGPP